MTVDTSLMFKSFLKNTSQLSTSLSQPTHFIMVDRKYKACGIAQASTLVFMVLMYAWTQVKSFERDPWSCIATLLTINGIIQFAMGVPMIIWAYLNNSHVFIFEGLGSCQQASYFFIILSMGRGIPKIGQIYSNKWIFSGIIVCFNSILFKFVSVQIIQKNPHKIHSHLFQSLPSLISLCHFFHQCNLQHILSIISSYH